MIAASTLPLVSVVIPTYNSARFLPQAIQSALDQAGVATEVIVVDDGSTDDAAEVVARFGRRVRYLWQVNSGPACARNQGIRSAQGSFIAFLDADDYWLPGKLQLQVEAMQRNPAVALVHTSVYDCHEGTGARVRREWSPDQFAGDCYTRLFEGNRITLSSVLVRKECLTAVGGFDEHFRAAAVEDYDLWLRLARQHPFDCLEEPLVVYRLHESNATRQQWRMLEGELVVRERALARDPTLTKRVGALRVSEKLYELNLGLGYHALEEGRVTDARRYFWRAARQRRLASKASLLTLAACLPIAIVRRMQSLCRGQQSVTASV